MEDIQVHHLEELYKWQIIFVILAILIIIVIVVFVCTAPVSSTMYSTVIISHAFKVLYYVTVSCKYGNRQKFFSYGNNTMIPPQFCPLIVYLWDSIVQ